MALRATEDNTLSSQSLTAKVEENVLNPNPYFPRTQFSKRLHLVRAVEAKVFDGDLRGAVKLFYLIQH